MSQCLARVSRGALSLEPIRARDAGEWRAIRARDARWLQPWEATSPVAGSGVPATFGAMVRGLRSDARAGRTVPWVIKLASQMVGQMTVSSITGGSLRSAQVGYWVASAHAGRGIAPTALALATDYCWSTLGLHRIEVNIRPENGASLRVVEKLGFRYEGLRRWYLHIAGSWADHLSFALTSDEVPGGLLDRWLPDCPAALRAELSGTRQ